jgi:hypothetical protein
MVAKKRSVLLVRIFPIVLVLLFLVFVLQIALHLFRSKSKSNSGIIPNSYLTIYAYGNVEREGPFYALSGKVSVADIALLAEKEFSSDYYQLHSIDNLYKISYSDCELINEKHVFVVYFPPDNIFPVYDLNVVTKNQLLSLGLSENAADRLLEYRNLVGKIKNKNELLKQNVLTEQEYVFLHANVETLPDPVKFLKKKNTN